MLGNRTEIDDSTILILFTKGGSMSILSRFKETFRRTFLAAAGLPHWAPPCWRPAHQRPHRRRLLPLATRPRLPAQPKSKSAPTWSRRKMSLTGFRPVWTQILMGGRHKNPNIELKSGDDPWLDGGICPQNSLLRRRRHLGRFGLVSTPPPLPHCLGHAIQCRHRYQAAGRCRRL